MFFSKKRTDEILPPPPPFPSLEFEEKDSVKDEEILEVETPKEKGIVLKSKGKVLKSKNDTSKSKVNFPKGKKSKEKVQMNTYI